MAEETRTQRVLGIAAWVLPLTWVVAWSLFRGAYAHGGYLWWERVHFRGAIVLVLAALATRMILWWRRADSKRSKIGIAASQLALVTAVVVVNWLCFQTGLAYHCPPTSVGEFFWQDP